MILKPITSWVKTTMKEISSETARGHGCDEDEDAFEQMAAGRRDRRSSPGGRGLLPTLIAVAVARNSASTRWRGSEFKEGLSATQPTLRGSGNRVDRATTRDQLHRSTLAAAWLKRPSRCMFLSSRNSARQESCFVLKGDGNG